jgi:ABC-type oligopeptide transport system ATPase subunit
VDGELILRTDGLKKVYRGRRGHQPVAALRGVTIELHRGQTLGIVGESGCGKSTLARLLVGLEPPTSGTITLAPPTTVTDADPKTFDASTSARRGELARRIQLVFQDPHSSLNPRLTVARTLREVLSVHRLVIRDQQRARVRELLAMVALPERFAARYPHELSGGQAQRVAIARALAVQPSILVLDEPTSALDVSVRAEVMNLLVRLQDELGLTYLFVSHDLGMVRHISDDISVMYLGRVVETGPYHDVLDRPLHPYTRALAAAVPVPDPEAVQSPESEQADPVSDSTAMQAGSPEPVSDVEAEAGDQPQTGCPYLPRCPLAEQICAEISPELLTLRPAHAAACHIAARGERVSA